jgi:HlyD family secretion protein
MRIILHSRALYILGAVILIGIALFMLVRVLSSSEESPITTTVTRGDVSEIVSVSGVIDSKGAADLAFAVSDIVDSVTAKIGDVVTRGDLLATLSRGSLYASRRDAVASIDIARANRDELIAGPQAEARDVTNTSVSNARAYLENTIKVEDEKVKNARAALLSNALEAVPKDPDNSDTAPVISGTYTCGIEGTYHIDMYPSGASSGYSYTVSGLESGTFRAVTQSAALLGSCGLTIQFTPDVSYGRSEWSITIPNARASTYTTYNNAYDLAVVNSEHAVADARDALTLAEKTATLDNAAPRDEALRRADAVVRQAESKVAAIDADIADRTLRAPFDGTISVVNIVAGETVGAGSAMTIVGDGLLELTARIPEIDIAKIAVGQIANVVFDARSYEVVPATVSFISPLAIEIDGVGYFEARLSLNEPPEWLRGGLNADIEIYVEKHENVLRIPKRFLIEREGETVVLVPDGEALKEVPIDVTFAGNDGFVEIAGLDEDDVIVAP